ncbi:MAG: hypothetical protein UT86_C0002G0068 [Candidatus Magasanikbacteria bacterium GW2011_GWC2_40_17]|uniref:Uncharacterized protein n=1 Tax=Candidatus Magasanikbacteria bacterium GW2011_GWA2_42_32 TaxID=1619039 RepID=A0A0G1A8I0_9BACT|nr:MAG: hypothetical protein UT86_C0002G0068 [Candidatus Magasanikbacteria bacterium GW2011_GWC2_40_17]KKS57229.1 MAG: hypothetical protein UV20_C0002G0018 [Candidatus Magasanikbacteria bacterium GW2011_GWA2_42_32]
MIDFFIGQIVTIGLLFLAIYVGLDLFSPPLAKRFARLLGRIARTLWRRVIWPLLRWVARWVRNHILEPLLRRLLDLFLWLLVWLAHHGSYWASSLWHRLIVYRARHRRRP